MGLSVDSRSGRTIGRGKFPVRVQRPRLQGELTVRPFRPGLLPGPDMLQSDVLRGVVVGVKRVAALRARKVRLRRSVVSRRMAAFRAPLLGFDGPVLLLNGEEDIANRAFDADLAESLSSGKLVVIKGAGHNTNLERPDVFADCLREFVVAQSDE
jgi:pimeloyl-ACP methyl ester carboxylesterase